MRTRHLHALLLTCALSTAVTLANAQDRHNGPPAGSGNSVVRYIDLPGTGPIQSVIGSPGSETVNYIDFHDLNPGIIPTGTAGQGRTDEVSADITVNGSDGNTKFNTVFDDVPVTITTKFERSNPVMEILDTTLTGVSLSGGGLPNGFMVRENPGAETVGQTIVVGDGKQPGDIYSYFDLYTQISTNDGKTWIDQPVPERLVLAAVPEPTSMALMACGTLAMATQGMRRLRRR